MLTLCLRTDKQDAEAYIYDGSTELGFVAWHAHRQLANTLHSKIKGLLAESGKDVAAIEKIVVFSGPGSFTGLRIGISVANALSYGLSIPIVGTSGNDWLQSGLAASGSHTPVQPHYGQDAHITAPRK